MLKTGIYIHIVLPSYLFDAANSLDLNKLDYHIWKELTQFVYKYQRESLEVLAVTTAKNWKIATSFIIR